MGCSNEREIKEKPNLNENIKTEDNKIKKQKNVVVKPKLIRIQSIKKNEIINDDNNNIEKNEIITIKNNNYLYLNNNNNNNENNKEDILTLYH